ncbi:MAG: DUF4062 domain-containing protein [Scytonema hyalinum WJT4-NPBG1]|jgi:hypothetical protein|nr:DUF4062 domain-containing protein [Scytonema hyalinum WJT4-NPBG1]
MVECIKAMISSTFMDLKEHRQQAILACLQEGVFPLAMETLSATNISPVKESLKLVDNADIYIGMFGYRYGTIPEGDELSITHQEYLQSCKRGIPRLIFFMDEQHPLTIKMVDAGEKSKELNELRNLLQQDRVVSQFKSPEDLRGKIAASLRRYLEVDSARKSKYLPYPVERYDRDDLLGRKESLASLTRWVVDTSSDEYRASIYVIVASSGMGKSLLAWKWFDSITPRLWKRVTWWSLYQKEDFEIFLKLTLVNLIGRGEQEISDLSTPESMSILLETLEREPLLLVLDGLEHALVNGESKSIALDRRTVDTPIEVFLDRFRSLDHPVSRILITTTSFPGILAKRNGEVLDRVYKHELGSLNNNEALELWKGVGLSVPKGAARDNLLSLMKKFGNHPLFIRALAGEVKQDPRSGGNFNIWWNSNQDNPLGKLQNISDWMSNLLNKKLGSPSREVLLTISAFYCPCRYNVLSTLMLERGIDEEILLNSLKDLEARGLINRVSEDDENDNLETYSYRIHQLIIDAGWGQLTTEQQVEIAKILFNILIDHGYYNDAYEIFIGRLNRITFERQYNSLRSDLLEKLFPQGIKNHPALTDKDSNIEHDKKAIAIASLVRAYLLSGELQPALVLSRNHVAVRKKVKHMSHAAKGQYYLSYELYLFGKLRESEKRIRESLIIFDNEKNDFWQVLCLRMIEHLLLTRGSKEDALKVKNQANSIKPIFDDQTNDALDGIAHIKNQKKLLDSIAAEVNDFEKQLSSLNLLAESHLSEGRFGEARQLLGEVLLHLDYRLIQADAFLILARIEETEGNREAAVSAANNAYKKAWCDGPTYVYHQVLEEAKSLLDQYGRPYPDVD